MDKYAVCYVATTITNIGAFEIGVALADGTSFFGRQVPARLSPAELIAVEQFGLDPTELKAVPAVKVSTVQFAAGLDGGDSAVCLPVDGEMRYGKIASLLVESDRRCWAPVALYQTDDSSLATSMRAPPQGLATCLQIGLYGKQFVKCFSRRQEMVVIDVRQVMAHCIFVTTSSNDIFACRINRHFMHD